MLEVFSAKCKSARRGTLLNRRAVRRRGPTWQSDPSQETCESTAGRPSSRYSLPVKPAQQRRGHASAKTMLDRYARLWPDGEDRTRDAVDAEFGSPAGLSRASGIAPPESPFAPWGTGHRVESETNFTASSPSAA
jgi:hypothetical protein